MLKKILYVFVVFFILISIGVFKVYDINKKKLDNDNFFNFTQKNHDEMKHLYMGDFYYYTAILNKKDLTIEDLDSVISSAKSQIIINEAELKKADILFESKKYKEALGLLNGIKSEIFKPQILILRGDVFEKMERPDLAFSEYQSAFSIVNNDIYKVVILEKIKNLKQ